MLLSSQNLRCTLPLHLVELVLASSASRPIRRAYNGYRPPVPPDDESSPVSRESFLSKLSTLIGPDQAIKLTDAEVESHNRRLSAFRLALGSMNLLRVRNAFEDLKHHSTSEALMLRDYETISRLLNWHFSECQDTRSIAVGTSEMAVEAAVKGHTDGLKACLLLYFRSGDIPGVISTYTKFADIAWDLSTPIPEHPAPTVSSDDTETMDGPTLAPEPMDQKSVNPGMADLLLTVIAAHAAEDRFDHAFDQFLVTPMTVRVTAPKVKAFCDAHLVHDPALSAKVRNWTQELVLLRLVSRQSSLSNYVFNLASNKHVASLENLYSNIISECRRVDGRLVARPEMAQQNQGKGERCRVVFVPNDTWSVIIKGFFKCHRADLVEKLWSDVVGLGLTPNRHMWTSLLDGYGRHGLCDKAKSVWNRMLEGGTEPDEVSYGAMVSAYFVARRPHEGLALFEQFRAQMGTTAEGRRLLRGPTILHLCNIVLHGLCTNAMDVHARKIMQEMADYGPKPDIVSYNIFLRHYGRIGDMKNLAAVLRALKPAGIQPDVHSFTTVLSTLFKAGKRDAHTKTLEIMRAMGVQPNVAMYSAIIDYLVREGGEENFRNAGHLLQMMENNPDKESRPNEVTYTGFLAGLHRDPTVPTQNMKMYAVDLFARMHKNGTPPNRTTYHYLIKACLENPDAQGLQMALGYYREMGKRGILLMNNTWYVILSALLRRGDWAIAGEVMNDMFKKGHEPDKALAMLMWRIRREMALNDEHGRIDL